MSIAESSSHPLLARWSRTGRKRILAIDGGGVRGIVALAFLERIEAAVQREYGAKYLAEHFDLIAGTSTGSIIAANLALGKSVAEIRDMYYSFCRSAFTSNPLGKLTAGLIATKFRQAPMRRLSRQLFSDVTLGDSRIRTGLLIVLHRFDSNSPWPVHNHPHGKYYGGSPNSTHLANKDFPISSLVLASCAAPGFFSPLLIEIGRLSNGERIHGKFIDGSLSAHKNPSLQALRVATISGYGFNWPTGESQLAIVSVGTGRRRRATSQTSLLPAGAFAVKALFNLLETCNDEVELLMQWMSDCRSPRVIDSEIGDLSGCCLSGQPLFQYSRFNLPLERQWLAEHLGYRATESSLDRLYRLDGVQNLPELEALAKDWASHCIDDSLPAHDRS